MIGDERRRLISTIALSLCLLISYTGFTQQKVLRGSIKDAHSDERIPFASLQFRTSNSGRLSDSAGNFVFRFDSWPLDTLVVTYVGYQDFILPLDSTFYSRINSDAATLNIKLERGKYATEFVVKRKVDRGLLMWRRIVKRKPFNDRYRFDNFSYELYNKLEVDVKNIKKDKWSKLPVIKQFNFVLNNIDTTEEGTPFLPVYLTEAISDYYYQKSPKRRREVFKGSKTIGVSNESAIQFLGGMEQNINFYSNFIPVFDKQYVSPLSDNGDNYYRYRVLDSQFVNNRRLIHMSFTPKRKGENTFEGDCWVHDSTWAVQKMNLRLTKEANINWVDRLSLIQEFEQLNDSTWFLSRDKFVVDLSLTGEKALSLIGRKTTTYRNVVINDTSVVREIAKNQLIEETIIPDSAKNATDTFWVNSRHEQLNTNEKAIYKTIDTLMNLPAFKRTTRMIDFLATGYLNIGNFQIGPWPNWITGNVEEGLRLRFDLGTNKYFDRKVILHGYLAYGFGDKKFKGKADAMWLINKNPRNTVFASFTKDFDRSQSYYDEISSDNIFALAIRKSGVPIKFLMMEEMKLEYFHEWHNGFSITLSGQRKQFEPIRNLPSADIFKGSSGIPLNTFETGIRFRFAYLEKFLESTFYRASVGSAYPITELRITKGLSGVFNSSYDYTKISASISDYSKIAPFGSIYYNVFGGKTYGTLPFVLLDVAPGNEIYYYNKYAFNLMNRFEYLHDRYAGINFEHNIGNGLFKFLPITRKLKFRQFWNAKVLWGSLSDANKAFNMPTGSDYKFESLDGRTYMEVGTGVDNIFKVFRLDLIWRLAPRPLPPEQVKKFGVFFSFRLAF
ncbi:MAG: carboxypeptidase-like regulatory domain-containing protein [Chitinophagaceae bacterium]|nr:carboxypeptidase-like regulatory domain-containing protein [Chitinophagaceae bacterium]